ncbi:hypothetical protein DOS84_11190 [Flavobacterium aquariorum]|uniref:Uncharacterized protein n=1 Tax=Flavobacterium aquariorum TaxID=2217670 RepID=A0A2W7TTQ9_9FLAO|nr:hypothetical protein DOS84_11190 [Flavobacterium aquariorum]
MPPLKLPHFTFYQTGCNLIYKGYSLSLLLFLGTSFLSTSAAKEKKQKNAVWLELDFNLLQFKVLFLKFII